MIYNQEIGGELYLLQNIWDHTKAKCDQTRKTSEEDTYDHGELRRS